MIGTVEVDGGTLAYEDAGEGPAVVLLHAGMLDSRMWDGQWAALTAGHRVVRYDARSHGRSSTAIGNVSFFDDLHRLIGTLGLDSPTLVGNSLGARTAVDFALEHPGVARELILIGPGISGMAFKDPYFVETSAQLDAATAARDTDALVEGSLRQWVDGPHRQPSDVDSEVRAACGRMIADTLRAHYSERPAWQPVEAGAIDRLGELDLPVEVLTGAVDMADILLVSDRIEQDIYAASQQRWPGVGHILPMERPAECTARLLELVDQR